jgi:hypothetical protein
MPWTGWQKSSGLGGNIPMDCVATFLWTGWQKSVEYAVQQALGADPDPERVQEKLINALLRQLIRDAYGDWTLTARETPAATPPHGGEEGIR